MNEASVMQPYGASPSPERLWSALLECLHCGQGRVAEIRAGDSVVLRREGTVNFPCPQCGAWTAHRLIRMGS